MTADCHVPCVDFNLVAIGATTFLYTLCHIESWTIKVCSQVQKHRLGLVRNANSGPQQTGDAGQSALTGPPGPRKTERPRFTGQNAIEIRLQ